MAAKSKNIRIIIGLIILIPIVLIFIAKASYSNNKLGNLHKDKLGISENDISRGAGDGADDPFKEGMESLSNKDYAKAISFFETVPNSSETFTQAKLYLSYAQYENQDFDGVIKNSQIVIERSENLISKQAAEWLQVQAMLASDKTDDETFDRLLDKIAENEQHMLQAEAKELDKSLNSFWRGLVF